MVIVGHLQTWWLSCCCVKCSKFCNEANCCSLTVFNFNKVSGRSPIRMDQWSNSTGGMSRGYSQKSWILDPSKQQVLLYMWGLGLLSQLFRASFRGPEGLWFFWNGKFGWCGCLSVRWQVFPRYFALFHGFLLSSHVVPLASQPPDSRRMFHVFKYLDVSEVQAGRNNMSCKKAPVRRVRRVRQMKLPVATGSRNYVSMCDSFSLPHRKKIL